MPSIKELFIRREIFVLVLATSICTSQTAIAQTSALPNRSAPTLGPAFMPALNLTVPNAMVTWGYWGMSAETCTEENASTRCLLRVTGGDDLPHSICVSNASLHFSPSDSIEVQLHPIADAKPGLLPARKQSAIAPVCFSVKPHIPQLLVAIVPPSTQKRVLAVSMSLEERLDSAPTGPSYKARARIPMIAPPKHGAR